MKSKMKKIAIIIPSYRPVPAVKGGGVEQLLTSIINENEKKQKLNIDIYSIYDKENEKNKYNYTRIFSVKKSKLEIIVEKITNKLLSKLKIKYIFDLYNNKVTKLICNVNYDKIIVENNMYLYKKIYNKYNKRTDFIFHLHNDIGGIDKPINLCNFISNTALLILTCSDFLTNKFKNITNSNNVYTLYNSIDLNKFFYDEGERKKLKLKYNLKNKITYLFIGRLSKEKGILDLVNFFKKNKTDNSKLFVIGDSTNSNKLFVKKIMHIINKCSNIYFLGSKSNEEIYKYISMCDAVIIPTMIEEAFGLVAIEAFACKCPVIATDSGGLIDLVKKDNGYLIQKNNFEESLKIIINKIEKNKKDLKIKGNNAYKFIASDDKYSYEKYYEELVRFLNK